jgi:hypothetical protein
MQSLAWRTGTQLTGGILAAARVVALIPAVDDAWADTRREKLARQLLKRDSGNRAHLSRGEADRSSADLGASAKHQRVLFCLARKSTVIASDYAAGSTDGSDGVVFQYGLNGGLR